MNSFTKDFTNYRFLFLIILTCLICLSVNAQENRKTVRIEERTTFERWLERDALYIITQNEKQLAKTLITDVDKELFVENFWKRRDPTPDTEVNEFQREYYQRIAYANEHLRSSQPGWTTDKGRIYILNGKPDKIETGRMEVDGIENVPFEKWYYKDKDFIDSNNSFTFVNIINTKEFRLIQN